MPRKAADALVVPIPTMKRLHPPPDLSERAKAEFIRIVTCEKPEHFKTSDPVVVGAILRSRKLGRSGDKGDAGR